MMAQQAFESLRADKKYVIPHYFAIFSYKKTVRFKVKENS